MELYVARFVLLMREQPDVFESEAMHSLGFSGFGRGVSDRVHAFRYSSHDKPGHQVVVAMCGELDLELG